MSVIGGRVAQRSFFSLFARRWGGGASVDPAGLFNAGLEGGTRRAVDIPRGTVIDEAAFIALIRAAVALNVARRR